MPEDVAIRSKRVTGPLWLDEIKLQQWRESDDAFEYDPAKRAAAKRNMARIRLMKSSKKRRGDHGALGQVRHHAHLNLHHPGSHAQGMHPCWPR